MTDPERWSAAEYRAYLAKEGKTRAHKYGAKAVVIDGHRFDSKAEGRRYEQLKLLERGGRISDLCIHPRYELLGTKGEKIAVYEADFEYLERAGRGHIVVVEDVKGVATPAYKLKKKLFLQQYRLVHFREIRKGGAYKAPRKQPRRKAA